MVLQLLCVLSGKELIIDPAVAITALGNVRNFLLCGKAQGLAGCPHITLITELDVVRREAVNVLFSQGIATTDIVFKTFIAGAICHITFYQESLPFFDISSGTYS
ncbi:hypothetical protein D9M68_675040 [compost metagenome]